MSKHYIEEARGRRCDTCISGEVLPSGRVYCNRYRSNYGVDEWCRNHVKRDEVPDAPTNSVDGTTDVSTDEVKEKLNAAIRELCAVSLGINCDEFKCKACGATYFVYVCPPGERHYCPHCGTAIARYE